MYKQLYKYTKKEWALGMIQKGEFFIGTLHGFKILERHGSEIGDAGEGTKSSSDDVNTNQPGPALDFLIQNRIIKEIPKYCEFHDQNG